MKDSEVTIDLRKKNEEISKDLILPVLLGLIRTIDSKETKLCYFSLRITELEERSSVPQGEDTI